jgi:hypothetical protein
MSEDKLDRTLADEPQDIGGSDPELGAAPAPQTEEAEAEGADMLPRKVVEEARREAAKYRIRAREAEERLKQLESALQEREMKELEEQKRWQEMSERYKERASQLEAELKAQKLAFFRQRVASRYASRLPAQEGVDVVGVFADLLQGDDEEAMARHAEQLIALFGVRAQQAQAQPSPTASQAVRQTTQAVPGGQPIGRTDEDRRQEYFGGGDMSRSPIFQKGKVIYHGNPSDLERPLSE